MPVITLSREMGSRGDDIALAVTERLKLRIIGRELINRAAKEAGAPEVALAEIDELGLLGVKPGPAALRLYRQKVTEVIDSLAAEGDVLLMGRGGQVVLAGRPGVLHVRIIAPRELRVQVVGQRCQVPPEVASARIEACDRARAGYLKRHYGVSGDDPRLYDLVLNMAHLDVAAAAELICLAAGQMARIDAGRRQSSPAPETGGCECR
jgi:cytidylate kinase